MKKFVFAIIAAVALVSPAAAQEPITRGPVSTSNVVKWTAPNNVTSISEAQSFEYRLYKGSTPVTAFVKVACSSISGGYECSAPLTQSNVDALNQVGVHQLTLSAFRSDVGEGPKSDPFTLTSPAAAPTGLKITQ